MHLVIIIIASHMILKKVTSHRNFTRILYWFASVITDVAVHAWGAPLSARAFVHLVYKGYWCRATYKSLYALQGSLVPPSVWRGLCGIDVQEGSLVPLGVERFLSTWWIRVFGVRQRGDVLVQQACRGWGCWSSPSLCLHWSYQQFNRPLRVLFM